MNTVSITKLYDLLSAKVGKETVEDLTSYIEQKIKADLAEKTNVLATKEALADTKSEIIKWMFLFGLVSLLLRLVSFCCFEKVV